MSNELDEDTLDGELIIPQKKDLIASLKGEDGLDQRERNFLDALYDEAKGDIRNAMTIAGYHYTVPISEVMKKLNKYIKERAKDYLIGSTAKAAVSLVNVLNDPSAVGAKTVVAATKEILDRGGIFKEEAVQVSEVRNMFILPPKDQSNLELIDND